MNKMDEGGKGLPGGEAQDEGLLDRAGKAIMNIQYWVEALVLLVPTLGGRFDLPGESPVKGMKMADMSPRQLEAYRQWVQDRTAVRTRICKAMDWLDSKFM